MSTWLKSLDLGNITLFRRDWGGLISLRLLAGMPERFTRVVAANTFLPTGDQDPGEGFLAWRKFSQEVPVFPVGTIIATGRARPVSAEVQAADDAPFRCRCPPPRTTRPRQDCGAELAELIAGFMAR